MKALATALENELGIGSFLEDLLIEHEVSLSAGARLMLLIPLIEVYRKDYDDGHIYYPTTRFIYSSSVSNLVGKGIDIDEVAVSLRKLIEVIALSPAANDREAESNELNQIGRGKGVTPFEQAPRRTSLSAIKAFWARFCNIPPFCSKTDKSTTAS